MPTRFKVHEPQYAHFVTSTVVHWIPVFCRDDYFKVLLDSLTHCIENRGLRVYCYVIMPNHFHMVCSQADGDIVGVIRDMMRYTSRILTKMLERDGREVWLRAMQRSAKIGVQAQLWDDGFHPEQVYSQDFFDQKCNYIHNNPVRAGYVQNPSDWKYSSAGLFFDNAQPLIKIAPMDW